MTAGGTVGKEKPEPYWAWWTEYSAVTCTVTGQVITLAYLTNSNSPVFPVIPPTRRNTLPWVTLFPSSLTDSLCLQPGNRENGKERERERRVLNMWKAWHLCYCWSVAKLCWTLWDSMDCSTAGFPVLHYLLASKLIPWFWQLYSGLGFFFLRKYTLKYLEEKRHFICNCQIVQEKKCVYR